ncbi:hypothetical protein tpqmel_0324 [Candidatus Gastranaerophilus sp. (ex Termes propinquus)]|nr:hypothetical protein tpqmel_0324 [Candidatus Gastranaerophilus sp. (ex Termes propinquus)]
MINFNKIIEAHTPKVVNISPDLQTLKDDFDFENYLAQRCGKIIQRSQNYIKFEHCPVCGRKECFAYYIQEKTWYCFGKNGRVGGSIIDFLIHAEGMSQKEAIDRFKHKLCNAPRSKKEAVQVQPLPKLETFSAADLMASELMPVKWVVDGILPQGLVILASPPKYGKSWLMADLGISVANGKDFLGYKTHESGTFYMALEDSTSRLQNRIKKILGIQKPPKNFNLTINAPNLANGLIDVLGNHMQQNPDTALIIIDTLQKIRAGANKNEGVYSTDYREAGMLKSFADKHGICVVLVHHLRKAKDDDVFNMISGTNGIMGAADTILALKKEKRGDTECVLHITGRDVEHNELLLEFNSESCKWRRIGNAEEEAERRQLEQYSTDTIVVAVRKLLELQLQGWCGTAQQLIDDCVRNCDYCIGDIHSNVAKRPKKLIKPLYDIDGIMYTPPSTNGAGGKRLHKFKHKTTCALIDTT